MPNHKTRVTRQLTLLYSYPRELHSTPTCVNGCHAVSCELLMQVLLITGASCNPSPRCQARVGFHLRDRCHPRAGYDTCGTRRRRAIHHLRASSLPRDKMNSRAATASVGVAAHVLSLIIRPHTASRSHHVEQ